MVWRSIYIVTFQWWEWKLVPWRSGDTGRCPISMGVWSAYLPIPVRECAFASRLLWRRCENLWLAGLLYLSCYSIGGCDISHVPHYILPNYMGIMLKNIRIISSHLVSVVIGSSPFISGIYLEGVPQPDPDRGFTLPKTNSLPLKIGRNPRGNSSSNHQPSIFRGFGC